MRSGGRTPVAFTGDVRRTSTSDVSSTFTRGFRANAQFVLHTDYKILPLKYSTSSTTFLNSSHPPPVSPRAPPLPSAEPRPHQTPETTASSPPHTLRCSSARARSPAPKPPAPLASPKYAT